MPAVHREESKPMVDKWKLYGVLATYRRPHALSRTLERLAAQTRPLDRLMVVDNGRDERCRQIVDEYIAAGFNASYVRPSANLGPSGAFAVGMRRVLDEASDEDWIFLFDDDDPPFYDNAIERASQFAQQMLEKDSEVGAVGISGGRFDSQTGRVIRIGDDEISGPVAVDHITAGGLPAYRVRAIKKAGVFRSELFFGFEELDYGLRLTRSGFRLYADGDAWRERKEDKRRRGLLPSESASLERRRRRKLSVSEPHWRRYYSLRNLLYILRTSGWTLTAVRVALERGIGKPLVAMLVSPVLALENLTLNLRAIRDGFRGNMGKTLEPEVREPGPPRSVGVVVPTIGDRPDIGRLLESVANQTLRPEQLRVVVDAQDSSYVEQILAQLQEKLAGIDVQILRTGASRRPGSYLAETGYGVAVNVGLRSLATDLVAFLDDDDEIAPTHFELLSRALDPARGVRAAYSRVMVVSPSGARRPYQEGPLQTGSFSPYTLIGPHPILLPAVLVERTLLDEIGWMDETFDRKADTDMLVRIGLGTKYGAVEEATYIYYRQPHGAEVKDRAQAEMARLIEKHQARMSRFQRWLLWDALTRSSLETEQMELARAAAREAIRALLPLSPDWLVGAYVRVRGSSLPRRLARLIRRRQTVTEAKAGG